MKYKLGSNFAIAILLLVSACIGFALWSYVGNRTSDRRLPIDDDTNGCDENGENCWSVEEHGKVAVAQLPEVQELAQKYGKENVKISALYYKLIEDENYIKRLIGDQYQNVDCLIPVESPGGKMLYIETIKNDIESYTPIPWEDFEVMLQKASLEDQKIFLSNINDNQAFVREYLP